MYQKYLFDNAISQPFKQVFRELYVKTADEAQAYHSLRYAGNQILPVHSQHRGRLFLPFVDDDPKTAQIISEILLFAEGRKIKDPFILEQIK